jgi:hypothetical protein
LTRVDPLLGSYTSDVSGDETHIGSDVLVVRARRDIQPHEEISISYTRSGNDARKFLRRAKKHAPQTLSTSSDVPPCVECKGLRDLTIFCQEATCDALVHETCWRQLDGNGWLWRENIDTRWRCSKHLTPANRREREEAIDGFLPTSVGIKNPDAVTCWLASCLQMLAASKHVIRMCARAVIRPEPWGPVTLLFSRAILYIVQRDDLKCDIKQLSLEIEKNLPGNVVNSNRQQQQDINESFLVLLDQLEKDGLGDLTTLTSSLVTQKYECHNCKRISKKPEPTSCLFLFCRSPSDQSLDQLLIDHWSVEDQVADKRCPDCNARGATSSEAVDRLPKLLPIVVQDVQDQTRGPQAPTISFPPILKSREWSSERAHFQLIGVAKWKKGHFTAFRKVCSTVPHWMFCDDMKDHRHASETDVLRSQQGATMFLYQKMDSPVEQQWVDEMRAFAESHDPPRPLASVPKHQRCVAALHTDVRCARPASHGSLCTEHMRAIYGVYVQHVNRDIGDGLFAARAFEPGEFIVPYTGDWVPTSKRQAKKDRYTVEFTEQLSLNADRTNTQLGRYVNSARGSGNNNAVLTLNTKNDTVSIKALHGPIDVGDQILIAYSSSYRIPPPRGRPPDVEI